MRFPRLIALVVTMVFAVSCTSSTAPPTRVTAVYVLESIGGQPLPTTVSTILGTTTTVLWGTLSLDETGKATIVEHRRNQSGANQQEHTSAERTDYELTGSTIYVGPPCRDDTPDCVPVRVGQITETTLTLSSPLSPLNESPSRVYAYRLALTE